MPAIVLRQTVTALQILLFVYLILRFFPDLPDNFLVKGIQSIAEVLLLPAKRLFAALGIDRGPIDWTPLFTIFLLNIAEGLLMKLLYG